MDTTIKITSLHLVVGIITGFSQWLWDGIMPFLVGWVITYTLLVAYL